VSLGLGDRLGLIRILRGDERKARDSMKTTDLDPVFPMMIALFNPGHFPIDLGQNRCSAFLGAYDGIRVRRRRYKLAVVVALNSDTGKATTKSMSQYTCRNSYGRTLALPAWPS